MGAKGVAPANDGGGHWSGNYWILGGSALSGGGFSAGKVFPIGWGSQGAMGLTWGGGPPSIPGAEFGLNTLGAYSLAVDTNGVAWSPWAYSNGLSYFGLVSAELFGAPQNAHNGYLMAFPGSAGSYNTSTGITFGFNMTSLPQTLSLAVGDPWSDPNDLWAVDSLGNVFYYPPGFGSFNAAGFGNPPTINYNLPPGAIKVALFNETLSCANGTMHQPFLLTSANAIYRYVFNTVGSCVPNAQSCGSGCWQQVPGQAIDITANDFAIDFASHGIIRWNNATQAWDTVIGPPSAVPAGGTLQGIGASPGFSQFAGATANLAAYDSYGNLYLLESQLFGQCGGTGWLGPTTCAFTQVSSPQNTAPTFVLNTNPAYPRGVSCKANGAFYSQCVLN